MLIELVSTTLQSHPSSIMSYDNRTANFEIIVANILKDGGNIAIAEAAMERALWHWRYPVRDEWNFLAAMHDWAPKWAAQYVVDGLPEGQWSALELRKDRCRQE